MRVVVQRVTEGGVNIQKENYHESIGKGLVIFLGIKEGDNEKDVLFLADKCSSLRVFEDTNQKMNLSLKDIDGEALIISQFTLYGDASKGNRPSFTDAARPETAIPLYDLFIKRMRENISSGKIKTGIFGALMDIKILNNGPVTIIIESR